MKTCKEVMTANPTCCTPDETVTRIAKLMKTENVGSIPICENRDSKKLIGIVTDRDLAIQVVAAAKDPHTVKASDIMTGNPITCRPDDDLPGAGCTEDDVLADSQTPSAWPSRSAEPPGHERPRSDQVMVAP